MKSVRVANGIVTYSDEGDFLFVGDTKSDLEPALAGCRNCSIPLTGIWQLYCSACRTGKREKEDRWVSDKMIQLREIGELTITTTSQSGRDRNKKAISDYWDS